MAEDHQHQAAADGTGERCPACGGQRTKVSATIEHLKRTYGGSRDEPRDARSGPAACDDGCMATGDRGSDDDTRHRRP